VFIKEVLLTLWVLEFINVFFTLYYTGRAGRKMGSIKIFALFS
jgi:hypothetical protein